MQLPFPGHDLDLRTAPSSPPSITAQQETSPDPVFAQQRMEKAQAIKVFYDTCLQPLTRYPAPYISQGQLRLLRWECIDFDIMLGDPPGKESFINPLPPQTIQKLLHHTRPFFHNPDAADFARRKCEPSYSDNWVEATFFGQCCNQYLTRSDTDTAIMASDLYMGHTPWVAVKLPQHLHEVLRRYNERGWQAYTPFRFHRSDSSGRTPDPNYPHVSCLVADRNPLADDMLNTSELMTAAYLAAQYFDEVPITHSVVPIMVVTCSFRSVRLLQVIVNVHKRTAEIRKSQIIDFDEGGILGNFDKFTALLGWVVGTPIGRTRAA